MMWSLMRSGRGIGQHTVVAAHPLNSLSPGEKENGPRLSSPIKHCLAENSHYTYTYISGSKYTSNLLTHMGRYFVHYHYQPNNNPHVNWKIGQNTHHAIVPDTFMTHPGVIPGLGGSKNSNKNTRNRSHFFWLF